MMDHHDGDLKKTVAAAFVSDLHPDTRSSPDRHFVDVLKAYDMKALYPKGDVTSGWRLKSGWHLPPVRNGVPTKLFRAADKGAGIISIPGNHKGLPRNFPGPTSDGATIADRTTNTNVDEKRKTVPRGEQVTMVVRHAVWLTSAGSALYQMARRFTRRVNDARKHRGLTCCSLSPWAARKAKGVVTYIGRFKADIATEARREGASGLTCGHLHHAAIEHEDGIVDLNDVEWMENCAALIEHLDGRFEIVRWLDARSLRRSQPSQRGMPYLVAAI